MTFRDLLSEAVARLESFQVPEPRLSAEHLLAHILKIPRLELALKARDEASEAVKQGFWGLVQRREGHEPLEYILGYQDFLGMRLKVKPGVLIPRPETEGLALAVRMAILGTKMNQSHPFRIADLGTGSGCLALALAREFPSATVLGIERSRAALAQARDNHRSYPFPNLGWVCGDFGSCLHKGSLTVVVSNPPYIAEGDLPGLEKQVRDFEPVEALLGGRDGLDSYREIIAGAGQWLAPGGLLALEFGLGQAEVLKKWVCDSGLLKRCETLKDLAGRERYLLAWKAS